MAILSLSRVSEADADVVGAKAATLARLRREGLPVPDGFVVLPGAEDPSAWVAAARALGGRLAVRSTAPAEDGPGRSLAGAFRSVVGVRPARVGAAVAEVRASCPPGSAVLVMQAVDAVAAGVLFTVHPVSGSWREMVVEAVHGLGGGLVSGRVRSSAWVLRRPSRLPRRVHAAWGRLRVEVLGRHVVTQERWDRLGRAAKLPPERRAKPPLDDASLRALGRLGLRLEAILGGPLDVEWCQDEAGRLWIVQARPVCAAVGHGRGRDVLWTRRFLGERFPDPVTPLGWSVVEPVLAELVGFPGLQARRLGGGGAFRLFEGRPYVNATVFRHLGFKVPGLPLPRFVAELLPPDELSWWNTSFAVGSDVGVVGDAVATVLRERRWARFAFNPVRHHAAWRRVGARIEAQVDEARVRPSVSARDGVARWQGLLGAYLGVHLMSLLFGHLALDALDGLLAAWAPDRGWREALATAPEGNATLAVLRDLDALAAAGPFDPHGAPAHAFLARHGHRAHVSWDPGTPRWHEDPESLRPLVAARGWAPPVARPAEPDLGSLGPVRATALGIVVRQLRAFVLLRENQRYVLDRLLAALRVDLLRIGDELVACNRVDRRQDVVWLTWEECALPGDLRPRVEAARRRDAVWRTGTPPVFVRGDAPVPGVAPRGQRWTGTAISAGVATGPARRVRTLADGVRVQSGDVLVAPAFDPSWAPLLTHVAGAVWEMGSVLSHGAIVARELRKPVVANLDGAVDAIRDGQVVTVDGDRGVIWVEA